MTDLHECRQCHTEYTKRRIPFGRVGYIELIACECEASRIAIKYSNTGVADNKNDLAQEGL